MSTGDLCEISGEVKYEWKIKDFLRLPHTKNTLYKSSEFQFCGSSWRIWIYPNGDTKNKSVGWIGLYLCKESDDIAVKVNYSFSLTTVDGKSVFDQTGTKIFEKNYSGWGYAEVISRSELIKRKSELLPSGVLTVTCTLKNAEVSEKKNVGVDAVTQTTQETGGSKLQHQFKRILLNGNVSDVVLAVDDREFKSHWCILAARSPVFLAMTTHDTKEKNSGVVDIPDIDPNTFSDFLNYLYTGIMENVTVDNVAKLFTAADKYEVEDLKRDCVDFMLKNITVDNFCDFLTVSLLHVEKELTDACSQFFMKNSLSIVLTTKWQAFLAENPTAGNELYIKQLQQKP